MNTAFLLFLVIVLGTLVITYYASKKNKNDQRILYRRRRIDRLAERAGHCGRLYVGGIVFGYRRNGRIVRL